MKKNNIFLINYSYRVTSSSGDDLVLSLTDLAGRQLRADRPGRMAEEPNAFSMDITGVQPGIYFATDSNAAMGSVTRVIISGLHD